LKILRRVVTNQIRQYKQIEENLIDEDKDVDVNEDRQNGNN
jgi:hypothetical protein